MDNLKLYKYNISVISGSCGIKPHTIRTWEKRYKVFEPKRDERGVRLYSDLDLTKANLLGFLTKRGFNISEIGNNSIEELKELKQKISHISTDLEIDNCVASILTLVENYDVDLLRSEVKRLSKSLGLREFIFDTVLPLLRYIGTKVANDELTVTQEHILSTVIRDQLTKLNLDKLIKVQGPKILLATPEGNHHEIAIMIADIICRLNGVATQFLGSAHPSYSLASAINHLNCPILVLGVRSSELWNYHSQIVPYLEQLDQGLRVEIDLIIGGEKEITLPNFKRIKTIKFIETFESFDKLMEVL